MSRVVLVSAILHLAAFTSSSLATSGADFLKLPNGSRSIAMGEAFSVVENDVDAISYNPAGLASLKQNKFSVMHLEWLDDLDLELFNMGYPFKGNTLAFSLVFFHTPGFTQFGSSGESLGTLQISDLALAVGYGRKALGLEWGMNFKYIRRSLAVETAQAFAVDLGLIKRLTIPSLDKEENPENLSFGLVLRNWGTKIKFINVGENLPLMFGVAAGYKLLHSLIFAIEIDKYFDVSSVDFRVGMEYAIMGKFMVRNGFQKNDTGSSLSVGAGIRIPIKKTFISADYGFRYDLTKAFKGAHAVSLQFGFGG